MAKSPIKTVSELQAELAGAQAQIESLQEALEAKEADEANADPLGKDKRLLELEMELAVEKDKTAALQAKLDAGHVAGEGEGAGKTQRDATVAQSHKRTGYAGFHPSNIADMPTVDELNASAK